MFARPVQWVPRMAEFRRCITSDLFTLKGFGLLTTQRSMEGDESSATMLPRGSAYSGGKFTDLSTKRANDLSYPYHEPAGLCRNSHLPSRGSALAMKLRYCIRRSQEYLSVMKSLHSILNAQLPRSGLSKISFCEDSDCKHVGISQAEMQNQGCYVGTAIVRGNFPQSFDEIQNVKIEYNFS